MTDYHTVYKGPEGETTQWEDIHRRLGNLPPKPPVWKPDAYTPEQEEVKDAAWLETRDAEELSELEDELADDRYLEQYRRRRIQELQKMVRRPRFGAVEEIRAAEFVQKVTEASRASAQQQPAISSSGPAADAAAGAGTATTSGAGNTLGAAGQEEVEGQGAEEDGQQGGGLWVVVQLYKDGLGRSALMSKCIDELAERYPHTKFVRIVSTDCIPKYPDANLPTLLLYHGGQCVKHLVGLDLFGGQHATPERVALTLNGYGPVCSNQEGDEGEQGEQAQLVHQLVKRMVDARVEDDESSDFDD